MATKLCENGHTFDKTSDCPVCPICSKTAVDDKYGKEFPNIGAPAFRVLARLEITKLSDLTQYTEKQLLAEHGFGPKALRLLNDALTERKLRFKPEK